MQDPEVPQDAKNYAAMVSMVDRHLGEVLELLRELDLEEDTIVFFTGDNGGQDRFQSALYPRGYFGPNVNPKTGVGFRGGKGNLYQGGLKIPFLVRWPGRVEAGRVSDLVFYHPDVMPTLAELTGAEVPEGLDGISILPEILGEPAAGREQPGHDFLYWEFQTQVAVRQGDWKAIRPRGNAAWELYDLAEDPGESNDVAADHPEVVAKLQAIAGREHEPARPGTYTDRARHEQDRRAKWGTARAAAGDGPGR
jgi:arylsulfatase A-like enzyme